MKETLIHDQGWAKNIESTYAYLTKDTIDPNQVSLTKNMVIIFFFFKKCCHLKKKNGATRYRKGEEVVWVDLRVEPTTNEMPDSSINEY